MATALLERVKEKKPASRKKSAPPHGWQVVMYYDSQETIPCCSCLLRHVFNMNQTRANRHVAEAKRKGRSVVFQSARDAVETKAADAQSARDMRILRCTPKMDRVMFKPEPAP